MNLGELGNAFMFATVCDMFVNLIGYNIYLRVLCQNSGQASQLLHKSNTESKISSASDYQVLFLKKTPKIISLVKQWNPNIQLVGFKLLANVSKEDLFKAARASLKRNQANIIVANDLGEITPNQHIAYLVDEKGEEMVTTK